MDWRYHRHASTHPEDLNSPMITRLEPLGAEPALGCDGHQQCSDAFPAQLEAPEGAVVAPRTVRRSPRRPGGNHRDRVAQFFSTIHMERQRPLQGTAISSPGDPARHLWCEVSTFVSMSTTRAPTYEKQVWHPKRLSIHSNSWTQCWMVPAPWSVLGRYSPFWEDTHRFWEDTPFLWDY